LHPAVIAAGRRPKVLMSINGNHASFAPYSALCRLTP
jgi:hypothetical protein